MLAELFIDIEKRFDMEHACGCDKWCTCWEDFKKKWLDEDEK